MSEIALRATPTGVLLNVKARPGGKRNAVTGVHAGALKVAVTAPPEKGKANDALLALLAEWLEIRPRDVVLERGHAASDKTFRITGVEPAELRRRLDALLRPLEDDE